MRRITANRLAEMLVRKYGVPMCVKRRKEGAYYVSPDTDTGTVVAIYKLRVCAVTAPEPAAKGFRATGSRPARSDSTSLLRRTCMWGLM